MKTCALSVRHVVVRLTGKPVYFGHWWANRRPRFSFITGALLDPDIFNEATKWMGGRLDRSMLPPAALAGFVEYEDIADFLIQYTRLPGLKASLAIEFGFINSTELNA